MLFTHLHHSRGRSLRGHALRSKPTLLGTQKEGDGALEDMGDSY